MYVTLILDIKQYNGQIRYQIDCSIYNKVDALVPKLRPIKGRGGTSDTYKDLDKRIKYHCHLNVEGEIFRTWS